MKDRRPASDRSELDLDLESMRRLGYAAVDLVVEHLARLPEEPAWTVISRPEAERLLREPVPRTGLPLEALLPRLRDDVLSHRARLGHPRFFAFIPSAPTFAGVLGDVLAAGFNPFVGTWLGGSGPSMLELVVLEWFRDMLGLPEGSGGLLTSGGSAATVTAFVAARHARLDDRTDRAVIYASIETHSAVDRAAWITGFRRDLLRKIPVDTSSRLDPAALEKEIAADRANGLVPFLVVGNAGTTSTGAVDPLPRIAEVARREGLWFHVDGAYGGFAAITGRGRAALAGLDLADSWVLDPHKWLFQGIECGSLILRRPGELRAAFHILPGYLEDVDRGAEEPNFADRGIQLTRAARAFKIWLSLEHHGLDAIRREVDRNLDLARDAGRILAGHARFEVVSPASLGVVAFRVRPRTGSRFDPETLTRAVLDRINRSGYAFLSSTRLGGIYAGRLCILGFRTTRSDVEETLARLADIAAEIDGG